MIFKIISHEQTPKITNTVNGWEYFNNKLNIFLDFLEFAKLQPTAVGLAANQCSLDDERFMENVFAIKNTRTKVWELIINPEIVEYIGMEETKLEGCLTWGRENGILATRYRAIKVNYVDINGVYHANEILKGFDAQIWQHECNHLNGVPEKIVDWNFKLPSVKEPGRNDVCPCGSGKKYKQCCLLLL